MLKSAHRAMCLLALLATTAIAGPPLGAPNPQAGAGPAALPHAGTTVQLPTFRFFAVGTTVSVPDRGAAYLGGVGRSATGRNSAGSPLLPGRNTGISSATEAGGISITAWIHDLDAMDRALLEQAARQRGPNAVDPAAQVLVAREAGGSATPNSLTAIRARQAAAESAEQRAAIAQFDKAAELEAAGKSGVAKIYYRMALKNAPDELRAAIVARLKQLDGPQVAGE